MAHFIEGGAEGSETGIAKAAVDINQWLKDNRLSKLKDYFESNEVEMEVEILYPELSLKNTDCYFVHHTTY